MQIDIDICLQCERRFPDIAFIDDAYCSPKCKQLAHASQALFSAAAPRRSPQHSQQQQQRPLVQHDDRQPASYSDSTSDRIRKWQRSVQPLEGRDARYSAGSPVESLASSPASSVASSSSSSSSRAQQQLHQLQQLARRRPAPVMMMSSRTFFSDADSLAPPLSAAATVLTADESPIPTPPSRSVAGSPMLATSMHEHFHRMLVRTSGPAPATTSLAEAPSHKHQHQHQFDVYDVPAAAIPIPISKSPRGVGHYRYRHKGQELHGRPVLSQDNDESYVAAPIVSRARAVGVHYS